MNKNKWILMIGIGIMLITCIILSLAFGSRHVRIAEVIHAFINAGEETFATLVIQERIPRTIFSLLAGAALGLSGTMMQSITRNPIADPSILGVNTGASLFVVAGIAFFQIQSAQAYIWFALAGAALTACFVYMIAYTKHANATPIRLALAGCVTSAALSSIINVIMLPRSEVMNAFRFWQVGSVSGATWDGIFNMLPFLLTGFVLCLLIAPALNTLLLGDDAAISLGIRIGRVRLLAALASVLLCGAVTALAGPIGFIGLMIPHIMRMLFGSDLRYILPLSAVAGAILLTLSDVIGRLIASPSELEVGIVTAFIGAPLLIVIVMKSKGNAL